MEHNCLVEEVFVRLHDERFAFKLWEYEFSLNNLSCMEFDIDSEGFRPKRSKIDAVLALEPPRTPKQHRSFMGILKHLQRFLPNLKVIQTISARL